MAIGNINTAGAMSAGEGSRPLEISWEAVTGHFFEATVYLNKQTEGFIVVRKVSEEEIKN